MVKIVRNTILNYLPNNFKIENSINLKRIFDVNNKPTKTGDIIYLCERELRIKDNFALQFAIQKSDELNLPLKILHPKISCSHVPKQQFLDNQIIQVQKSFQSLNLDFQIINKTSFDILKDENIALLILDFNPLLKRNYLKHLDFKIYEIDSHNIIPARFASDKQEYNASTLRRKIYYNIYPFMTEFKNISDKKVEADYVLESFIKDKLSYYAEYKNNPSKNVLSNLSKYLNLGFISSQRVAIEVIKSNVSKENKEAFLEELIIRKEIAENFCLYSQSFKNLSGIPYWVIISIENHRFDIREYIYTLKDFEQAKTHDKLWNSTQIQLIKEGVIHGYLRMYWVKKILEWTNSVEQALKIAIYLNDKYAYDAPSSSGYVGILWGIGGLHDRAFKDYLVTGKIRRMTYNSLKKKFDLKNYMEKFKEVSS